MTSLMLPQTLSCQETLECDEVLISQYSKGGFDQSPHVTDAGGQQSASFSRPQGFHGTDFYKWEENRLRTFDNWGYQSIVRKEDLARNGLIYTGSGDKVRCVFCNILLLRWDPDDVVEQEHRRANSRCPFLRGEAVGNVPLSSAVNGHRFGGVADPNPWSDREKAISNNHDERHSPSPATCGQSSESSSYPGSGAPGSSSSAERGQHDYSSPPKNPAMALEPTRLATYSLWPSQMTQKPEQLARCGLYYTGDGDRVKCFHCDTLLFNWEPNDDPFREHARWSPDCQYLQLLKGERFVDDVQQHRQTEDELMETPAVQALLFDGHSAQTIQKALGILREKNVRGDQVSAEALLMTIMEQEHPAGASSALSSLGDQSEDIKSLVRENESLREKQQCKICMENEVEVIFFPCRHFVCCASCSAGLTTCPICREPIHSRDKVFMA